MKSSLGIWTVRTEGIPIGRCLKAKLGGKLFTSKKSKKLSNCEQFRKFFLQHSQWILIMATGIAVRYLQGLPRNKKSDPAVVVLDEGCRFAISLLAGHEGGANRLTYEVANITGAIPVITTATEATKPLVVGIGCRKGVKAVQINTAVRRTLKKIGAKLKDIFEVVTIDLKAKEPGLISWCKKQNLPLRIISKKMIQNHPWVTQPSNWVQKNIGVEGVCEPCALLAAPRGKLITPKTAWNGVTVAIVEDSTLLS